MRQPVELKNELTFTNFKEKININQLVVVITTLLIKRVKVQLNSFSINFSFSTLRTFKLGLKVVIFPSFFWRVAPSRIFLYYSTVSVWNIFELLDLPQSRRLLSIILLLNNVALQRVSQQHFNISNHHTQARSLSYSSNYLGSI